MVIDRAIRVVAQHAIKMIDEQFRQCRFYPDLDGKIKFSAGNQIVEFFFHQLETTDFNFRVCGFVISDALKKRL